MTFSFGVSLVLFAATVTRQRPLPNFLKPGRAQLLVVDPGILHPPGVVICEDSLWYSKLYYVPFPDMVLQTALAVYMGTDDYMQKNVCPLPTLEEVLVCNQTTTTEEV